MSSTAVGREIRNCQSINYCDKSDEDSKDEDEDTYEPTSTVPISQRKPRPETSLIDNNGHDVDGEFEFGVSYETSIPISDPKQNDDESPKYKRKFGGDLSNMASSLKKRPAKKRNSLTLSVVTEPLLTITLDRFSNQHCHFQRNHPISLGRMNKTCVEHLIVH